MNIFLFTQSFGIILVKRIFYPHGCQSEKTRCLAEVVPTLQCVENSISIPYILLNISAKNLPAYH